jgi:hypothetical protein
VEFGAEATARSPSASVSESLFYADGTMMCPDHGAVDHVGGGVALTIPASVSSIASNTPVVTQRR